MALTTIDDVTLVKMIRDPRFQQAFPCLRKASSAATQLNSAAKKRQGCGSCSNKKRQNTATAQQDPYEVLAECKRCIKDLSGKDRKRLKQLLKADKVRVHVPLKSGKRLKLTF